MWSTDYHTGPISCQQSLWEDFGISLTAKISYQNCARYNVCAWERVKGLPAGNAGFNLLPCPYKIRRDFFDAYKTDAEFAKVDVFLCSHPTANCELYLAFNRSIIMYEHTPLEFGRFSNKSWMASSIVKDTEKARERWNEWCKAVKLMSEKPNIVIAANNLYHARYIKYMTGVDALYLPSYCPSTNVSYSPTKKVFLIGGSRWTGEFWLQSEIKRAFALLAKEPDGVRLQTLLSLYPKGYTWQDVVQHPGVVMIPYQVSTMSMLEYYRHNIPIFAPSLKLSIEGARGEFLLRERIYGQPPRCNDSMLAPNPNSNSMESLEYWIPMVDWLQLPHIILYDSAEDLYQKMKTADLMQVSERMREFNGQEMERIKQLWQEVFLRTLRPFAPGKRVTPSSFAEGMQALYPDLKIGSDEWCLPPVQDTSVDKILSAPPR